MNRKERFKTALRREQADRVPLYDFLFQQPMYEVLIGHRPGAYNARDAIACALGLALHLPRGQRLAWPQGRAWIPGGAQGVDHVSQQQQLPVGQGTQPHPMLDIGWLGAATGIQAQMLLHEAKGMFDRKAPQVHPA